MLDNYRSSGFPCPRGTGHGVSYDHAFVTKAPEPREAFRRWCCHLFGIPESNARRANDIAIPDKAAVVRQRIPRAKAHEKLASGAFPTMSKKNELGFCPSPEDFLRRESSGVVHLHAPR